MSEVTEKYRGFNIVVTPVKDHDDLWDFDYQISRADGSGETRRRGQSAGGHASADIAAVSGIQVARIEVDNLLALVSSNPT